jgi:protein-disulfide isomerase
MARTASNNRSKRLLTCFGLGILIFTMVLPLLFMIPWGGQSQAPADLESHQALVSEVILSTDRAELIGDSPTRGNPDASLVLLKFSDFQCGFCRAASGDMKTFMDEHESDVLYVYKHLPLTQIHPEAVPAARASWAAQQQDQFWPFHDALFAQPARLGNDRYEEIAQELGLDMEQFNRDRNSSESQDAVNRDLELSRELRLSGTPTFVFNNLLLPGGTPMEVFEAIVQQS